MRLLGAFVVLVIAASLLTGQTAWLTGVWDGSTHALHAAWVQVTT